MARTLNIARSSGNSPNENLCFLIGPSPASNTLGQFTLCLPCLGLSDCVYNVTKYYQIRNGYLLRNYDDLSLINPVNKKVLLGENARGVPPAPYPVQRRIQDFSEGCANPRGGAPTYYLANFPGKLHENEEILGRGRVSLMPSRSAHAVCDIFCPGGR